jgi:hypothetical protein
MEDGHLAIHVHLNGFEDSSWLHIHHSLHRGDAHSPSRELPRNLTGQHGASKYII